MLEIDTKELYFTFSIMNGTRVSCTAEYSSSSGREVIEDFGVCYSGVIIPLSKRRRLANYTQSHLLKSGAA